MSLGSEATSPGKDEEVCDGAEGNKEEEEVRDAARNIVVMTEEAKLSAMLETVYCE